MKRPEFTIDRINFTSTGAFAREIMAWLEFSEVKVIAIVRNGRQEEELFNEMGDVRTLGRVKVERITD